MLNTSSSINYTSLLYTATQEDIESFYLRHPEIVKANTFGSHLARLTVGIFATFFVGILTISLFSMIASGSNWTEQAILTGGVALFFAITLFSVSSIEQSTQKNQAQRYIRLERFATDNNMVYIPKINHPGHTGVLFLEKTGLSRQIVTSLAVNANNDAVNDVFQSTQGIQFEVGSYTAFESSGHLTLMTATQNGSPYTYICIQLTKQLPHMLLDNKANDAGFIKKYSNTALAFNQDQVLSLEGDFNRYFTLYAPKGYEQDALYIFSPDFIRLLVDRVKDADVELIGNRLYIYKRGYMPLNEAGISPILELINLIGTKAIAQTKNYSETQALPDAPLPVLKKKPFIVAHVGQIIFGTLGAVLLLVSITVQFLK